MKTSCGITGALVLAVAVAAPTLARGQALLHAQSVYADEKGAPFNAPDGIACRAGVAVVADSGNGRLVQFGLKAGSLVGGREIKHGEVVSPGRVQLDSKGNIYVLDQKTRRIARFDAKGTFSAFVDVKPVGKAKVVVVSYKVGPDDAVYVLDGGAKRVVGLDASGKTMREIAVPPEAMFADIAVEQGGRVFAVDPVRASVWLAEANAGKFVPLSKSLKEHMNFPVYIAKSGSALLLVDQYGHGIVNVNLDGTFKNRQGGMGWTDGLLYYPSQLCVGDEGEVVVADRSNNRVQVYGGGR